MFPFPVCALPCGELGKVAAVMSLIILMSGSYQNWYLLIAFFFQNCSEFPDSLYVVIFLILFYSLGSMIIIIFF